AAAPGPRRGAAGGARRGRRGAGSLARRLPPHRPPAAQPNPERPRRRPRRHRQERRRGAPVTAQPADHGNAAPPGPVVTCRYWSTTDCCDRVIVRVPSPRNRTWQVTVAVTAWPLPIGATRGSGASSRVGARQFTPLLASEPSIA